MSLSKIIIITVIIMFTKLVPVPVSSKAWLCGGSLTGIAGSNPVGVMDVCLF